MIMTCLWEEKEMRFSDIDKELIARIAKEHGVTSMSLFGSTARGEDHQSSDIDLLVDFEPGRSLIDLVRLERELSEAFNLDFDVLTPNSLHPRIRERVNREKLSIY
jgi:uncharacterized protein